MRVPKLSSEQGVGRFLFEALLIVLSVLLALSLNEYRSELEEAQAAQNALTRVENEIEGNLQIVRGWLSYHKEIRGNLEAALENRSRQAVLATGNVPENILDMLMPKGLFRTPVDDSAWQALTYSQAFSNIEYNTILRLSRLYKMQSSGVESTLTRIQDILFSREVFPEEDIEETLFLLRNAFRDLAAQEATLIGLYETTLSELEKTS